MAGKDKKEKEATEAEAAEGEGEAGAKKKMSGKKLILFIVLPALLVLGAGGGAAYFLLFSGKPAEQHASADESAHGAESDSHGGGGSSHGGGGGGHGGGGGGHGGGEGTEPGGGPGGTTITPGDGVVFVSLPDMLVNITSADGRPAYLKLRLTLEAPDDATVNQLTEELPRVSDQFNGFLRELRTDDLSGSAGTYRLRLELLRRVNLVIAPAQINAVLIEEMLVQ